ncbi:MAG: hypothetical protein ACRD4D_10325 [Candidatus Acidiferrales bacterium]
MGSYEFACDGAHRLLNVKDTNGIILEAHTYSSNKGLTSERAGGRVKDRRPTRETAVIEHSVARVDRAMAAEGRGWPGAGRRQAGFPRLVPFQLFPSKPSPLNTALMCLLTFG